MVSATTRPPCHLGLVVSVPFQCLVHGWHAPRGVEWLGGVGRTCRPGMSLGHLPPLPSGDSSGATRAQAQDTPPLPAQLVRDPSQARQCFLNRLFISEQLDFQKCCRGSPGTLRATPVLPFRALTLVRTRPPPLPVAGDRPPDLTRMVPVFLAAPGSTPGSHGALPARARLPQPAPVSQRQGYRPGLLPEVLRVSGLSFSSRRNTAEGSAAVCPRPGASATPTRHPLGPGRVCLWSPRAATNSPFLAPPTKSGLRWARAPRTCTCSKGGVRICHLQPARETWLLSVSARTRAPRPRVPARFSQLRNPGAVVRPRPVSPSRFLLWSHRMLQAHLAFSPPSPAMSYSSRSPGLCALRSL